MKKQSTFFAFLILIFITASLQLSAQFQNISPVPGSKYHKPQTTLVFRASGLIDESSILQGNLLEIKGSKSGMHEWTAHLSEGRTIIIKPKESFNWGETVQVTFHSLFKRTDGSTISGTSFSFDIMNELSSEQKALLKTSTDDDMPDAGVVYGASSVLREGCSIDSLPSYMVTINNNPAPGQIFHNNQSDDKKDTNSFPTIINNDGSLVWTCDQSLNGHDFKVNKNGYMTYFNYEFDGWVVMDSNYAVIDSVQCGNGYEDETNGHEIMMYPDGHTFVIAFDPQTVDMSQLVTGGNTNALVKGLIIQELDAEKQVIFQWRSWDHFLITDINPTQNLTAAIIDYVHGNAVERDNDGNILISSRNMSEISKINLETGEFVWRMGGKNNQFTFVNDNIPEHWNYQHDIRRIANGNVTLFNNAVDLPVEHSEAKEYQLDEINKVATLIWHYEHPPIGDAHVFGTGSGSVQRLENGNTLISWGKTINSTSNIPNYTEVDTNNNIVWEFKFEDGLQRGYRVHKYSWKPCEIINPDLITLSKLTDNSVKVTWNQVHNAVSYDLQYRKLGKVKWKFQSTTINTKKLINLKPESGYEFHIRTNCSNGYTSDWSKLDTFATEAQRLILPVPVTTVMVYPNPVSGILNLQLTTVEEEMIAFSIYDLTGKKMMEKNIDAIAGESSQQIDVAGLPDGYYIAEFKTPTQNFVQKFVKQ
ncbi:MAG: aryl-sulfate sulfotransferase [Chitinophagaceae bacterium]|nr:aryl-sulfate sulfotransferase [Chitinophagaceae bacterium]